MSMWELARGVDRTARTAVVSRSRWGAAAPAEAYTPRGPLAFAVLHHTSLPAHDLLDGDPLEEIAYVKDVERGHRERGFSDIGYHFVILPSGRVYSGRPPDAMGAHVRGHNRGTVGIAMAGDFEVERPTGAALEGLRHVRGRLARGRRDVPLVGHRSLARTSCPGAFLGDLTDSPPTAVPLAVPVG